MLACYAYVAVEVMERLVGSGGMEDIVIFR